MNHIIHEGNMFKVDVYTKGSGCCFSIILTPFVLVTDNQLTNVCVNASRWVYRPSVQQSQFEKVDVQTHWSPQKHDKQNTR